MKRINPMQEVWRVDSVEAVLLVIGVVTLLAVPVARMLLQLLQTLK